MCFKNPFAELKKKLKRQPAGGRHELERRGANAGGEGIDLTGSLAQPEPHVETGAGDELEGNEAKRKRTEVGATGGDGTGGMKIKKADSPSQPDIVPLLKSVADGLATVLNHYDVRPISPTTLSINNAHYCPSDRWSIVK